MYVNSYLMCCISDLEGAWLCSLLWAGRGQGHTEVLLVSSHGLQRVRNTSERNRGEWGPTHMRGVTEKCNRAAASERRQQIRFVE